jgi:hypothetical protein
MTDINHQFLPINIFLKIVNIPIYQQFNNSLNLRQKFPLCQFNADNYRNIFYGMQQRAFVVLINFGLTHNLLSIEIFDC